MSSESAEPCADKAKKSERSSLDRAQDSDDRIHSSAAGRSERSISETDVSSAGAYLSRHLSAILPAALGEIALKKPVDPVEYLGQWLLHYRECEDRERRRREFEAELLEERLKLPRDEALVVIADDYCEDECEDSMSFDY
ncbi:uncharacterized protein LOC103317304 isoform X2 [Nasonia vitripennis]|uniref:DPY30 domain-containing protein 2 n=1 Tax=Nasonia vitripennis TaxID=7425 RepID=A0A7M7PYN4_NASVI|nr:uncharacterized protein LOC103317304 isoform X2 [Nasonia vitripennis]XP_032453883.1 uncharacterized protein LOC103317304 isoform X2 [Nasonia vitripennis]